MKQNHIYREGAKSAKNNRKEMKEENVMKKKSEEVFSFLRDLRVFAVKKTLLVERKLA